MLTRGPDKNCPYFPCHEGMEDCTFCYCPFYPCINGEKGKFTVNERTGARVWDCSGCGWIHEKSVAMRIFSFMRGQRRRFLEQS